MKKKSGIPISLAVLLLGYVVHAQIPETNAPEVQLVYSALTNKAPAADKVLPHLSLVNEDIAHAIDYLARTAGINYLTTPQLEEKWTKQGQPPVSFELENVTALSVLLQMLALRHLALAQDPASSIAYVIPEDQIANPLFAGMSTNQISQHTNLIPLIQFSDVPITTAIENLARQEGVNYMMDPNVLGPWENPSSAASVPEPLLSVRFQNVTCWAALNRILNVRGLILRGNTHTHIGRITFAETPSADVDVHFFDSETNSLVFDSNAIPLIQFTEVPLDCALANLVRAGATNAALDARLLSTADAWKCVREGDLLVLHDNTTNAAGAPLKWFDPMPNVSIRWEGITAKDALVALCEDYGLNITRDSTTGNFQIEPNEALRRLYTRH